MDELSVLEKVDTPRWGDIDLATISKNYEMTFLKIYVAAYNWFWLQQYTVNETVLLLLDF